MTLKWTRWKAGSEHGLLLSKRKVSELFSLLFNARKQVLSVKMSCDWWSTSTVRRETLTLNLLPVIESERLDVISHQVILSTNCEGEERLGKGWFRKEKFILQWLKKNGNCPQYVWWNVFRQACFLGSSTAFGIAGKKPKHVCGYSIEQSVHAYSFVRSLFYLLFCILSAGIRLRKYPELHRKVAHWYFNSSSMRSTRRPDDSRSDRRWRFCKTCAWDARKRFSALLFGIRGKLLCLVETPTRFVPLGSWIGKHIINPYYTKNICENVL